MFSENIPLEDSLSVKLSYPLRGAISGKRDERRMAGYLLIGVLIFNRVEQTFMDTV